MDRVPLLLNLPEVALEKILSNLSYDEIAKSRRVCRKFNQVGGNLLSRSFFQIEKRHSAIYKRMKSMLPRRESERRSHPLSRHCDILSAIETRLSMLSMTYLKYIESNVSCFIPGKVLDEIDRILTLVDKVEPAPRTHELLQELRDISSMAMEHFDEIILPRMKHKISERNAVTATTSSLKSTKALFAQVLFTEVQKVKKQTKLNKQQASSMVGLLKTLSLQIKRQAKMLREKTLKIKDQERKLQEQATKLQEQETSIADLKKHVEEWDQKFSELTTEVIRAREDSSTNLSTLTKCNIKPRTGLSKFFEIPQVDLERKRKAMIVSEIPHKMPRTFTTSSISDDICNKINENITSNISKSITDKLTTIEEKEKYIGCMNRKSGFVPFLSSSLEMLFKAPINSIKSRKRKLTEDIDMK